MKTLFRETYGAVKCQHTGRKAGSVKSSVFLALLFTELVQSHAGLARKTKRSRLALGDICPLGQSLAFGLERFSIDGKARNEVFSFHLQREVCTNPFRGGLFCDK